VDSHFLAPDEKQLLFLKDEENTTFTFYRLKIAGVKRFDAVVSIFC
jgi:hypothetical protein